MTAFADQLPPDIIRALHAPFASWQVRWQRDGWQRPSIRYYETEAGARGYIEHKLLGGDRPALAPILSIEIYRRPVGYWELQERVLP